MLFFIGFNDVIQSSISQIILWISEKKIINSNVSKK